MRSSKSSKSFVILLVVGILVVVNGIAFLLYTRSNDGELEATSTDKKVDTGKEDAKALVIMGKVDELRKQAIEHLVNDEFEDAVGKLSEALTLSSDEKDLPQLLSLAKQQLQQDRRTLKEETIAAVEPVSTDNTATELVAQESDLVRSRRPGRASRTGRGRKSERSHVEARLQTPEIAVQEAPKAKMGTLAVVSTPSVAFTLDGVAAGVTPRNISVTADSRHTIAFLYKGESIARRTQSVESGKTMFVSADLGDEIAALSRPEEVATLVEKPQRVAVVKLKPEPKPKPTSLAKNKGTGELFVVSPNLYGEIYVNGRSYGKPPRVIKNLPVGPVRVEIRVQGKARRAKMAKVIKGERAKLRFR